MKRIAVLVALFACVLGGAPAHARQSGQERQLDARIGPPKARIYKSIRDGRDWKNPILIIGRDGVELRTTLVVPGTNIVSIKDLRQALIELPLSSWPYGRVVALSDAGILSGEPGETEAIVSNREMTLAILKALRVTGEEWPA